MAPNPRDFHVPMRFHGRRDRTRGYHPQEMPMNRLIALVLLAMFSVSFLAACNTVEGAGKDVQKVGEKVEDAAENTGGTDPN
jgi:predicted small secreted protein